MMSNSRLILGLVFLSGLFACGLMRNLDCLNCKNTVTNKNERDFKIYKHFAEDTLVENVWYKKFNFGLDEEGTYEAFVRIDTNLKKVFYLHKNYSWLPEQFKLNKERILLDYAEIGRKTVIVHLDLLTDHELTFERLEKVKGEYIYTFKGELLVERFSHQVRVHEIGFSLKNGIVSVKIESLSKVFICK